MNINPSVDPKFELASLLSLSARIGRDPLLTQGSTGNASVKLRGRLWIKASGKWMADAERENILVPLDLAEIQRCVRQNVDPAERHARASIETAMHAVFPRRVVLHVHCVNTIAWAVRQDAPAQLESLLRGLNWKWIPYAPSGLTLAREIEKALQTSAATDVLILGNHGLVLGGDDCDATEALLFEVRRRLSLRPRQPHPPDYAALAGLAERVSWDLPDDDEAHALATDSISRSVLSQGLLYPCQAIFFNSTAPAALFRPVPFAGCDDRWESFHLKRPFVILEGRGVILNRTTTPAARAILSGLAQVVQRIGASAPIRYLTESEIPQPYSVIATRYRELSGGSHDSLADASGRR
jgi:rhamnose utilization protein RhaD (predicted bifunctional aldolase and dehydrogenase)